MNLLQRIIAIRKALPYIKKDKSVSTGGGSYKAVTHDAVTALAREHMNQYGVVCWPSLVASKSCPREEGAKQFRYEATYDFTFANADDPNDHLVIRMEAHAMDNADKAPGKALSYAKKYAVLKLLEIETGEDEESRYAEFDPQQVFEDMLSATDADTLRTACTLAHQAIEENGSKPEHKKSYARIRSECMKKLGIQPRQKSDPT